MSYSYPSRVYFFSDTFGGQDAYDPLRSPDADALITTDLRSGLSSVRREFDTFGAAGITDHVLRTLSNLHAACRPDGSTGVFINSAPRTEKGSNGKPFYRAETAYGLRVVATPLEALSPLKKDIVRLHHLPNEHNGLYEAREQFRSSFTVVLLTDDHGLTLVEDDPATIPDPKLGCHLAYVDRFGNMILREEAISDGPRIVDSLQDLIGQQVMVIVGNHGNPAMVGESLAGARPGELTLYPNDGNMDIVRKWEPGDDAHQILRTSAYSQLQKPKIGSEVRITQMPSIG